MKKNSILASLLLAGFIENSLAALPTGALPFDVNLPSLCDGPIIGLTALHWETSTHQYDYALTYPPDNNFLPVFDGGTYHSIDPDSRWNFQLDLGYIFCGSGNEVRFTYLNYWQHENDFVTTDPFTALILPTLSSQWPTTGSLIIGDPLLGGSGFSITAEPNLVTARADIRHDMFNLDFGQFINLGSHTRLKCYGGLKYATLGSDLDVIYNYSAFSPEIDIINPLTSLGITINNTADFTQTIRQNSHYRGIGPHFGLSLNYSLCNGFGLVGDLSASLLIGRANTSLDETFTHLMSAVVIESDIASIAIGDIFSSETSERSGFDLGAQYRVVPNFDGKVGIDYSYQCCNPEHTKWTIELGYRVSHYFNPIDRVSEVSFDDPATSRMVTQDAHFEGLYLSFQINV